MITKKTSTALGFLLPAAAIYLIFTIYPLFRGLWLSFTNSHGGPTADFVGLINYQRMLVDPAFWSALGNTLAYSAIVVVVQNAFGLALARALYQRPRVRRGIGVAILLPTLVSPLLASFLFSYLLAPNGALNESLRAIGLGAWTRIWLGDPSTALIAVASVNIWIFAGYSATIFLAGYLALPADVMEAAEIDGARGWRRFYNVEWPLLAPALTVNVTLALIGSLKVFEYPLVLTNGGPAGATTTLTLLIYRDSFISPDSFSYAVAIAVALLLLVVVLGSLATVILRSRENRI